MINNNETINNNNNNNSSSNIATSTSNINEINISESSNNSNIGGGIINEIKIKNSIIEKTTTSSLSSDSSDSLDEFNRKSITLIDNKLTSNKKNKKIYYSEDKNLILNGDSNIFTTSNTPTSITNNNDNNNNNYENNDENKDKDIFNKNNINNNKNDKVIISDSTNTTPTLNGKSVSLYMDSFSKDKKDKKVNAESLRGPIIFQNFVLYTFFLLIIGTAEGTSWAPEIRVANFVPYCVMCVVLLEFNRLHKKPLLRIIFPLYTSNIPFAYMCIFSREAHVLISLLFFSSCLCIFLQSGISDLRKHIIIFCIIFMVNYACCILFMEWFYIDTTGTEPYRGRVLAQKIHWGEEATILVSMALLGCIFIVLEKFIKSYARCVAEQHYQIQCLQKEKEKLECEMISISSTMKKMDLDTPIEKIMDILRSMINTSESENDKKQLIKVIAVLGSNKLYDPDFKFETCTDDAEVYSWLQSMLNREVGNGNSFNGRGGSINGRDNNNNNYNPYNLNYLPSPNLNARKLTNSEILSKRLLNPDIDLNQEEIQSLISNNFMQWDFPVFKLAEITDNNPLYYLSYFLFTRHKFFEKYKINIDVFKCFMIKIEQGYDSTNPYHNSIHATDVLQNLNFFIEKSVGKYLSEVEKFSMIVAAIIHDFKHPGQNNHFQINSKSKLAMEYNDKSILENYHLSQAFKIMNEKDSGILQNLNDSLKKEIRETIIALVLSTDMAKHFNLVGRFKSMITSTNGNVGNIAMNTSTSSTSNLVNSTSPSNINNGGGTIYNFNCFLNADKKDRLLLMKIAIKCADVSNPSKPWHLYTNWSNRVMEEFYKQGDKEKLNNMDISAFMDRNKPATTKCQISFINIFVNPIYEIWSSYFPEFKICHQNVLSNLNTLISNNINNSNNGINLNINNNSLNNIENSNNNTQLSNNSNGNSNNSNSFGLQQSHFLIVV